MDGDGPHEQIAGRSRCGRPYPGDGPTRRASGEPELGAWLCPAVADRRPQGLRYGSAHPFWLLEATRTTPGQRATTKAKMDAVARVALCAGRQVVPTLAARG